MWNLFLRKDLKRDVPSEGGVIEGRQSLLEGLNSRIRPVHCDTMYMHRLECFELSPDLSPSSTTLRYAEPWLAIWLKRVSRFVLPLAQIVSPAGNPLNKCAVNPAGCPLRVATGGDQHQQDQGDAGIAMPSYIVWRVHAHGKPERLSLASYHLTFRNITRSTPAS